MLKRIAQLPSRVLLYVVSRGVIAALAVAAARVSLRARNDRARR